MSRYRVEYLTDRQERIVGVIRGWIREHGEAPTVKEIGEAVGLRSPSSVHYQLTQIEEKGAIVREPGQVRGIRLT
jgi:SOS-response transcriptional repressor LexA